MLSPRREGCSSLMIILFNSISFKITALKKVEVLCFNSYFLMLKSRSPYNYLYFKIPYTIFYFQEQVITLFHISNCHDSNAVCLSVCLEIHVTLWLMF